MHNFQPSSLCYYTAQECINNRICVLFSSGCMGRRRHRFRHATQDCVVLHVDHILHRDRFWAISIASGSARLRDLRSCCMVLSQVIRRHPRRLLHRLEGEITGSIVLAYALSIRVMCPKKVRRHDWTIAVSLGCPVSLRTYSEQRS